MPWLLQKRLWSIAPASIRPLTEPIVPRATRDTTQTRTSQDFGIDLVPVSNPVSPGEVGKGQMPFLTCLLRAPANPGSATIRPLNKPVVHAFSGHVRRDSRVRPSQPTRVDHRIGRAFGILVADHRNVKQGRRTGSPSGADRRYCAIKEAAGRAWRSWVARARGETTPSADCRCRGCGLCWCWPLGRNAGGQAVRHPSHET